MDLLDGIFTAVLGGVGIILVIFGAPIIAVIVGVVLLGRFIYRRVRGPKAITGQVGGKAYAFLEEEASQDKVVGAVQPLADDAVLGQYAQDVLATFEAAEVRRKGIFSILEQEFGTTSLTWDKFSAPVNVALDAILHNSVQLANHMQAFDSKEFQRMGRLEKAGAYKEDSVEVKRLATMRSTLEEMDEIQAANDRLLAELERLQSELTKMSGAGYDSQTEEIAAELNKLAEETKYYT